jgi:hypothetical protein
LSWLFIAALGIIWGAFLLPFGARRASPASTVEEFERKMDLLAETNRPPSGRWVLVPRKGERFLGPRDRMRMRARRRRRVVFTFLVEATLVTALIGLFPPLRGMLLGTAVLGGILVLYVALLLRLRTVEVRRDRALRRSRLEAARFERFRVEALQRAAYASGNRNGYANGNGHGRVGVGGSNGNGLPEHRASGQGHSNGNGRVPHVAASNGNGHGHGHAGGSTLLLGELEEPLFGAGVRIIEDDVHVIVRRTSDLEAETGRRAAR